MLKPQHSTSTLSVRHKAFADNVLAGMSRVKAYMDVYPEVEYNSAKSLASTLVNRPDVKSYMDEISEANMKAGIMTHEEVAMEIQKIATSLSVTPKTRLEALNSLAKLQGYWIDRSQSENITVVVEGIDYNRDDDDDDDDVVMSIEMDD